MEVGWGMKFVIFRKKSVFGAITVKTTIFLVQTVEFLFKLSNFNLN
jgi:hypothetical protein